MTEIECFGADHEKYALSKLLERFARKYAIRNVLEIPASVVKAMPSVYSLGWHGCNVTLMNAKESQLSLWEKLGLKDKVTLEGCARL